jgi:hypothetical protein
VPRYSTLVSQPVRRIPTDEILESADWDVRSQYHERPLMINAILKCAFILKIHFLKKKMFFFPPYSGTKVFFDKITGRNQDEKVLRITILFVASHFVIVLFYEKPYGADFVGAVPLFFPNSYYLGLSFIINI